MGESLNAIHRRPPISFIQEIAPFLAVDHFSNLGDTLVTRAIEGGIGIDFTSGATLSASATRRFELVQEPFTAGTGTIPAGEYDFEEASISYQSSAGRPFSANVSLSGGSFYSGDRRSVGGSFRWLVNPRMAITGSTSYNRIDLPDGAFNSSVFSGRVKYGFSTRFFASANIQYNEVTDQLVTYARINVIHAPLSDLFFVFSERRQLGINSGVLERAFTAKMTRLLSF